MTVMPLDRQRILDEAIELASQSSWTSFSFLQLSESLDCPLADIAQHFRCKDDMAEAFFDRADQAMWALAEDESYHELSSDDKLVECIFCWFQSFSPYRPLVKEMLGYKFEPGHFNLQADGITRVSRTVQWFLEVARREHSGLRRIVDECAVTSAFLAAFSCFLFDTSEGHGKTYALLKRLIHQINQGHQLFVMGNTHHAGTGKNKNIS